MKRPCDISQTVGIIHICAEHRVLILSAFCHACAPFAALPLLYHKKPLLSVKLAQYLAEQPFGEYAFARMPSDVRGVFHRERLGGEGAVGCG